jgi:YVTN family beta-propeller protein
VKAVIPTGGTGAGRIAVSPDGKFAASTHSGSGDVALIDTATRSVVAAIPLGKGPGFPLFSPDSAKLYVMNAGEGDVAVIDVAAKKVSARHKVGVNPFGGAIRPVAP